MQALRSELQTNKAELDLAARTDDVLAARLVVLHPLTTGGTGPDGGACINPLHPREVDHLAALEKLQDLVAAVVIVTAVRSRSWTFPLSQTLPAEVIGRLLLSCTYSALDTQVGEILPLHT